MLFWISSSFTSQEMISDLVLSVPLNEEYLGQMFVTDFNLLPVEAGLISKRFGNVLYIFPLICS